MSGEPGVNDDARSAELSTSDLLIDHARTAHATLVLAHGAGAPMDTPFMQTIAAGLCASGVTVVRFEFDYMRRLRRQQTRGAPERMPALEARFRHVVEALALDAPLYVGGKSMGARVAVRIADAVDARGVLALGYPFHPPGKSDKLRIDILQALTRPALIVQGTRDPLGSFDDVARYELPANIALHWLDDGDHSFAPRKRSGRTLAQNLSEAVRATCAFMRG